MFHKHIAFSNFSKYVIKKVCASIRGGVEDTRLEASAKDTKKNPKLRPRTAFPRTEPIEAKDRNARGQGPRTQAPVFSKKKKNK